MASQPDKPVPILVLEPSRELRFKGLFTDPLPVELKLINPSRKRLSFKIKTTAPRAYTVRPNSGIVPQNDKTTVIVTLQPFEYNPNEKYTHKFMVQSIVIPDTATQQEIDSLWLSASAEQQRMDSKIRCVLEYRPESRQRLGGKRSTESLAKSRSKETLRAMSRTRVNPAVAEPHRDLIYEYRIPLIVAITAFLLGAVLGKFVL